MIAEAGKVQTSPKGSFSFPYGAAAMTHKLAELEHQDQAGKTKLEGDMKAEFQKAYNDLEIPQSLLDSADRNGGFTLYLSGGGFRGWGYLLMSQHKVSPYPIPIINGFQVTKSDFQNIARIETVAAEKETFRVSKRRATQVPAVAFLVNVLVDAFPNIKEIRFCQGGVREGFLFDTFDETTRAMDPLSAASAHYGSPSSSQIAELLMSAMPPDDKALDRSVPTSFAVPVVRALANLLFVHSSLPKESASLAALYSPINGLLASAHGVSHTNRALLALMLCQRWDGELPPPHNTLQDRLRALLTRQEVFWCSYLGKVANLVGNVYPAGKIGELERIGFKARWSTGLGKKGLEQGVVLSIEVKKDDPMTASEALRPFLEGLEAVAKKKHRVGGKEGWYVQIEVSVARS
jgi:retrograde regulation protein 2